MHAHKAPLADQAYFVYMQLYVIEVSQSEAHQHCLINNEFDIINSMISRNEKTTGSVV